MQRRYPHVQRVEVPHGGPTCKADCLNFIVEAILTHEKEKGTCFAGVVLHDSEDVLHPLELKYFNSLLPRHDMIQLPVISLRRKWSEWVGSTYMDEFAESHKEMLVRERLTGTVPSAGVGTCFSRRALVALVGATKSQPFNTASLTEDYEIGMRLSQLGMRSTFGWLPVKSKDSHRLQPLSVAEFFPGTFAAAVRQKARWAMGIGLQSWRQIPWRGRTAAVQYILLHDRKAVVTPFLTGAAYLLLLLLLLFNPAADEGWPAPSHEVLGNALVSYLLILNLVFLANRLGHRFYFTARLYGWKQGLLSWPRMVVGNFVNFFAVARAWRLYTAHVYYGQRLAWDKTMHDYPTAAQLGRARQRLGELLVSWQAVPQPTLELVLKEQQAKAQPLGKLLVAQGHIDEEMLADAIAYQADLPRGSVSAAQARACTQHVPPQLARGRQFVPLGFSEAGKLLIGVARPLQTDDLAQISKETGFELLQRIMRDSEIQPCLEFLFHREGALAGAQHQNVSPLGQKVS
jgi:adsorption protein B